MVASLPPNIHHPKQQVRQQSAYLTLAELDADKNMGMRS